MIKAIDLSLYIKDRPLFEHLNLELPDQGVVMIKGDNGTGKTSLLMTLALLLKPTSGRIFYDDVDMTVFSLSGTKKREDEAIYLAPDGNFEPEKSIKENLEKFQVVHAEMAPFADRYPSTLSGGEIETVVRYLLLHTKKKTIFLDEGLFYLDKKNLSDSLEAIAEASKSHLIILTCPKEIPLPACLTITIGQRYAD